MHVSGWAGATVPGQKTAAVYLTIHNGGRAADQLLAVSSPIATSGSMHRTVNAGGVLRMRPSGPMSIIPGQQLQMAPGGLHVMLHGLKAPLRVGSRVPVNLRFAKAGIVRAQVTVQRPGKAENHGHHAH